MPGRRRISTRVGIIVAVAAALLFVPASSALAATITVTTTTDEFNTSGTGTGCSLREAIKSVGGNSAADPTGTDFGGCVASGTYSGNLAVPDTIMLPNLGSPYHLTLSGLDDSDAAGDLDVFRSMNIVGSGNPTIQQTVPNERVIDTPATGKNLSISGVTITGGDTTGSDGAGIHFDGGGSSAQLTLDRDTITGNTAGSGATPSANGGGIWTDSPTTITNSVITNNKAAASSGLKGNGGGIYQDGAAASLTGVTLTVQNSSITGNFAGDAVNFASGGGIFRVTKAGDTSSGATIQDTEVSGNTAHFFGGGIDSHSDGNLDITRSLISGNHALGLRGGGIEADSSISGNLGTLNVLNTTVTGNDAFAEGGGIHAGNDGKVNVNLLFSTIAQNTGNPGSEFAMDGSLSPTPSYTVEGTAFVATDPTQQNACNIAGTTFVNRTDGGYNVSTDPTDIAPSTGTSNGCGLALPLQPGDHTGAAVPLLGALMDNGGPTKTMQPLPNTVLIDNMANSVCTAITPAVTTDQRGFPRPDTSGANCDTGAYEVFTCNGVVQNAPGPFSACVPPAGGGGGGGGGAGTTTAPTGQRAAALAKCKKKRSKAKRRKCRKRANLLPV